MYIHTIIYRERERLVGVVPVNEDQVEASYIIL